MRPELTFHQSRADRDEIQEHLMLCETDFIPPLSVRTDIRAYTQKVFERSSRFEAWSGGRLIGLVAAYFNDPDTRVAYITNVSVLRSWRGEGIARGLLGRCLDDARKIGFDFIELEVDRHNEAAIRLYDALRFQNGRTSGSVVTMFLELGRGRR